MDGFKTWILSISGATVISGFFKIFFSDSNFKKSINIFFSLFVLFYTVLPLKNIETIDTFNNIPDESNYEQSYTEGYKKIIEQSILNVCSSSDIVIKDIECNLSIDEDGNMVVNEIYIKIDGKREDEVESLIKKELGFEVTVGE